MTRDLDRKKELERVLLTNEKPSIYFKKLKES